MPEEPRDAATTAPSFALPKLVPMPDGPWVIGDRYELAEPIGRGGTATVYRARDIEAGHDVALKLFERDMPGDDPRHLQEIAIVRRLRHPGLVEVTDFGTDGGRAYLVMSLVEGESLAVRLKQGPMPVEEVREYAARLADALTYVHGEGVTHRDLKPANVLLAEDGPMISDFGIARTYDATRVTRTGEVIGTAAYMAPEQVAGEPVGFPADIYSLGLVLLECLTGRCEYPGTPLESAVARLHRSPVVPADLPAGFTALLTWMTAREVADRPTAGEVVAALEPGATLPAVLPGHRRTQRIVAACGLAAAAATLTAVVLAGHLAPADTEPLPGTGVSHQQAPVTVTSSAVPLPPSTTTVVAVNQVPGVGDTTGGAPGTPSLTTSPPPSVPGTSDAPGTTGPQQTESSQPTKTKHSKPPKTT